MALLSGESGFVSRSLILAGLTLVWLTGLLFGQANEPWSINRSPLPPPTGFVNDYAGVIDSQSKEQLEEKLKELKESTSPSVEVAVAVVRTTGERAISEYSLAVARGWGIGSKEDDNPSALLFVAIDDRKYFTQISKDLEDELPDGVVGSLQRQYLVPEFRRGNYSKGISDTIDAYIAAIKNKSGVAAPSPAATEPESRRRTNDIPFSALCCCALVGLILVIVIVANSRKGRSGSDRDRWGGGGFGGTGGGIGGSALPWIVGGILSGSGSSSGSSDWGGSSGGGSDWGGFGGGGDFGGGGAGGDW